MPRVLFSYPPRRIKIEKFMDPPAKYQDLTAWLRQARKVIPQIPDIKQTDWAIFDTIVTEGSIIYELRDSVNNRCVVVIERRKNRFAA